MQGLSRYSKFRRRTVECVWCMTHELPTSRSGSGGLAGLESRYLGLSLRLSSVKTVNCELTAHQRTDPPPPPYPAPTSGPSVTTHVPVLTYLPFTYLFTYLYTLVTSLVIEQVHCKSLHRARSSAIPGPARANPRMLINHKSRLFSSALLTR